MRNCAEVELTWLAASGDSVKYAGVEITQVR